LGRAEKAERLKSHLEMPLDVGTPTSWDKERGGKTKIKGGKSNGIPLRIERPKIKSPKRGGGCPGETIRKLKKKKIGSIADYYEDNKGKMRVPRSQKARNPERQRGLKGEKLT